jgi:hypothetical protein
VFICDVLLTYRLNSGFGLLVKCIVKSVFRCVLVTYRANNSFDGVLDTYRMNIGLLIIL